MDFIKGIFGFITSMLGSGLAKWGTKILELVSPSQTTAGVATASELAEDYEKIKKEGANTENVGEAISDGIGGALKAWLIKAMPGSERMAIIIGEAIGFFANLFGIGKMIAGLFGVKSKEEVAEKTTQENQQRLASNGGGYYRNTEQLQAQAQNAVAGMPSSQIINVNGMAYQPVPVPQTQTQAPTRANA